MLQAKRVNSQMFTADREDGGTTSHVRCSTRIDHRRRGRCGAGHSSTSRIGGTVDPKRIDARDRPDQVLLGESRG
jgi:hypothetical protein